MAGVAVVTDGGGEDEGAWAVGQVGEGLGQRPGALDPAVADALLLLVGPSAHDALSGEVDDRIALGQGLGVEGVVLGIPEDVTVSAR